MSQPSPHERKQYRVVYPTAAWPWFIVASAAREVVDLGERGLRSRARDGEQPVLDGEIRGLVRLRRGEESRWKGEVGRLVDRQVARRLSRGIPLRIILDEQRYLREHHRGSAW